jgi:hypothetical protein
MTEPLTKAELGSILVSLGYSKKKICDVPVCIPGEFIGTCYPDYAFKRQQIADIERLIDRVREVSRGMKEGL